MATSTNDPENNTAGDNVISFEDSIAHRVAENNSKFAELSSDAQAATNREHALTFRQALKRYPKAMGWSMFLSAAVAMEGYDLVLLASFYAFPAFQKKYGQRQKSGSYQVTAPWQSGLSDGARVGEILGLFINGIVSERFGYKKTMIGALLLLVCFIFIPFFAQNIVTLEVGEILQGIPWGVFQTLTTAYAAEVCPVALRGYLTTYVNMMWGVGQLISVGVLRALLTRSDQWAYRIPFAIQWIWPIPLIVGVFYAPESPWWLVRKGRHDDARNALTRLDSKVDNVDDTEETLAMMIHTDELEKEISSGTSYLDCFKGVDLRRTEITCLAWALQPITGGFMGFSTYFFEQAGLSTSVSFDFSISLQALATISVFFAWILVGFIGRRTHYLLGLTLMTTNLFIIGFVSLAPSSSARSYATGSLLLVHTVFYDITVGTITYSVVAEMPTTRLRAKTIVLARNLYNVVGLITGILNPYMLNPSAWGWGAKAGFFWGSINIIATIWVFFRLPEPKGRTFEELDILFERGISARKFKGTLVDPFGVGGVDSTAVPERDEKD